MHGLKKLAVLVGFSFVLAFAFVGCAQGEIQEPTQDDQAQKNRVTDVYGRSVMLPEKVETVATVGSAARFVVYAGAQDKLIAATEMEAVPSPARPYTVAYKELFAALPSTSNGNHLMETSVNSEELLSLQPDVIVSSRSAAECDDLQAAIGIPVVGISYQDQMFSDDVYASIETVGQALGTADHAQQVVASMQEWAADLDARTASIPEGQRPSCYVGAVNYKGAKSFGGTYIGYAPFKAVNVNNVADEPGQTGSVEVELEQLGTWNPDFMFLNVGNMDLMKKDYADNQAFFDMLQAFQAGDLYSQPSFNFNGTNVEMGICDAYFVGFTVYPEAFADLDPAKIYDEIFETLLGTPYYETMKEQGMDFKKIAIAA